MCPAPPQVSRDKQADRNYKLDGCVMVGRSRDNDTGDGYIRLEDDSKVSREHCKIDTGVLTVLVTDLGSSKGTRLDSKDGDKIMAKVILPGQVRPLAPPNGTAQCHRPMAPPNGTVGLHGRRRRAPATAGDRGCG